MRARTPRHLAAAALLAGGLLAAVPGGGPALASPAARATTSVPTAVDGLVGAPCLDPAAPLGVEEERLGNRLPRNDDPSVLQADTFGQQMVDGGGLTDVAPAFVRTLCAPDAASRVDRAWVTRQGTRLWRTAVARVQGHGVRAGALPRSDDRPLYWARLQVRAALQQWRAPISDARRQRLLTSYDRAARGTADLRFPRRGDQVLVSGFDPYTLDEGTTGPAPGSVGNNIRHGNPSGATALALDGTSFGRGAGARHVQAYVLPVNYTEFAAGYLEDTVGPLMRRGLDASITVSQAGGAKFDLEHWNGRYHGPYPGNDLSQPCPPRADDTPRLAVRHHGCNTEVVARWGGPGRFDLRRPPQWTTSTLPVGRMIAARTGRDVPRPPGDDWPDRGVAFGVRWHTTFTEFPDCRSTRTVTRNDVEDTDDPPYPPVQPPVPPSAGSCSYQGGGGNYLSNESAYRNTLLRDRLGLRIPAGHIHTPDMQHFADGHDFRVSDATFDAWRTAIVAQTRELVAVASQ